jgi:hypothetical protein
MTRITEPFLKAATEIEQEEHTNILMGTVIKRRAERIGGYKKDSILPSDYCYNYVNRATYSCRTPLFVWKSKISMSSLVQAYRIMDHSFGERLMALTSKSVFGKMEYLECCSNTEGNE